MITVKSKIARLLAMGLMSFTPLAMSQSRAEHPEAIASMGIPHAETEISRIATYVANSRKFFEEDYGWVSVEARYDPEKGVLFLDPGIRLGPISGYPEVEDLHASVNLAVRPIAELLPNYARIEWRYGGHDLYYWFPKDRRQSDSIPAHGKVSAPKVNASVLVSAGHGYYFHHGYNDWRPQREVSSGLLEDQITPILSELLGRELMIKGTVVTYSRIAEPRNHEPSKQPYQMVAARYQLAEMLSFRPDIWHSLPSATHHLRDYHEDIRSRPLYANFLGVDEAIHLHTNANEVPSSRGATVVVQEGRPDDARLGNLVLCYMKEHIHSIPSFAGFPVAPTVHEDDKGENRLAEMPSIIVELGYHTNELDAALLKDERFRDVAMRGVAKGYRLYKDGRDCQQFAMSAPKESHGIEGQVISFPVAFAGHPDFPVAMSVIEKDCNASYCHRANFVFYREEDLLGYTHDFLCGEGDSFREEAVLVASAHDTHEVQAPEITHKVTCARRA